MTSDRYNVNNDGVEPQEQQLHSHGDGHDHVHDTRATVEQVAVEREGEEPPGKVVALALLRLLQKKEIVTADQIQKTIDNLQNATQNMLGAELVVRAWKDPAFKARLLQDGNHCCVLLLRTVNFS
jgi:hypothetical protein